ncbi:hypothetical protein MHYP_G00058590 [Metynnis hypsauchen]
MFVPNLPSTTLGVLPFLFNHCFLSLFLPLLQHAQGELQKSCSRSAAAPIEDICQLPCQCRRYPPLPPPPPPPPPPRLLTPTGKNLALSAVLLLYMHIHIRSLLM